MAEVEWLAATESFSSTQRRVFYMWYLFASVVSMIFVLGRKEKQVFVGQLFLLQLVVL